MVSSPRSSSAVRCWPSTSRPARSTATSCRTSWWRFNAARDLPQLPAIRRILHLDPVRRAVRASRNIQLPCWVIAHYRQRTQSGRPIRGDLALFTPTQEIALAPEPLLTFTCPKTKDRTPTRVEADARTLRASWKSRLLVECPSCGEVHEISVRDAYLNAAVDVVGQPDRQRVRRIRKR